MAEDLYYSISGESQSEFKDRGSRFLAILFPVLEEDEFFSRLQEIKQAHHKANHHCYAFRLHSSEIFRSSDDGEPSGTAGKPILNQLYSSDLEDVGCVVVRYFGGTKLGVSGLINAYREAAKQAIGAASIKKNYDTRVLGIAIDYGIMGVVMDVLSQLDCQIIEKRFEEKAYISFKVRESLQDLTVKQIKSRLLNRPIEDIDEDTKVEGLGFL